MSIDDIVVRQLRAHRQELCGWRGSEHDAHDLALECVNLRAELDEARAEATRLADELDHSHRSAWAEAFGDKA